MAKRLYERAVRACARSETGRRNGRLETLACATAAAAALVFAPAAQAGLTFGIYGNWDSQARKDSAWWAMNNVVNRYNVYGDFTWGNNGNIPVYYNAGVPTAQSGYGGYGSSIEFGGTYPNDRVGQHESNHWLGSGTYWNWEPQFDGGGVWTGPKVNALIQQFDGVGSVIRRSGVHFYGYGLNYDSEVTSDSILMRNVALMYAMRQDMGIGPFNDPWTATSVTLTASDPRGTSAFNWFGGGYSGNYQGWSDKYFAHAGAAYFTGARDIRTPDGYPSWTFAGDSLTVQAGGQLLFNGYGATGVVTIKQLNLNAGTIKHDQFSQDLFQLAGRVTISGASTIDAANGNINVLGPVNGTGSLTTRGGYTTTLLAANTYTGTTTVAAGTLAFAGPQSNVGSITVANGAKLSVRAVGANSAALVTPSLTLGNVGATTALALDLNSIDTVEPVISTGVFTANGTVNVTLQNAGALTSGVHKLVGYTSFAGGAAFPAGTITLGPRSTGTVSNNVAGGALNLNVIADRPVWTGADNGNWVIGSTGANKNWKLQTTASTTDYIAGDNVLFDDSAPGSATVNINAANVSPAATVFNNGAKSYTVSSAGGYGIAGAGGLTKGGAGAVTITTANTFTGDVVVNGGTLYANPGNAANNRAFSFVRGITVNSGGTLRAGANALFGWNGSQEHPIAVNAGGTLTSLGTVTTDVAVGLVTLNGGTLATDGSTATDYGSFRFDEATDKLLVTNDSVVSAARVKFGNPSATIEVTAGKTLSFTGTVTDTTNGGISYLNKSGAGTVVMSGPSTYTGVTTVNGGTLRIAGILTSSPTVDVNGGGRLEVTGTYGNTTTNVNNGTLVVSGASTSSGNVWIGQGNGGSGALDVQAGGRLTANVLLIGSGGSPTTVATGTGTLAAGGTINTNQWLVVGQSGAAGSSGTLTVNGGTVNVHTNAAAAGDLEVGTFDAVNATLNVNAGSNVRLLNNASLVLGAQNHSGTSVVNQNGGNVTVYLDAGSSIGGAGKLILASAANPTGNYTYNLNGGTLTVARVVRENTANNPSIVFNFNGGTLRAAADGANLISNLTAANVQAGGGAIDTNGRNVSLSQVLRHDPALGATSDGGLTKAGAGTLTLGAANTYTGTTTITAGTLRVDGSVMSPVEVQTGILAGNGQLRSNVNNAATVAPGVPGAAGRLTVGGNYQQQATGRLQAVITGAAAGTGYDRLNVGGTASLGGTLELTLGSGFLPLVGQSFTVVAAAARVGTFDAVSGVTAPASQGLSFAVTYTPSSALVTAALPGDVDLDRTVGPGDFNLLASNFGKTGQTWSTGDLNGDGLVGPGDFNLLASTFGQSAPGGGGLVAASITAEDWDALNAFAATSVPEPAGVALAASGAALLFTRRGRRAARPTQNC